jgi:hypothetical protein
LCEPSRAEPGHHSSQAEPSQIKKKIKQNILGVVKNFSSGGFFFQKNNFLLHFYVEIF